MVFTILNGYKISTNNNIGDMGKLYEIPVTVGYSFIGIQSCLFIYLLSMATFIP